MSRREHCWELIAIARHAKEQEPERPTFGTGISEHKKLWPQSLILIQTGMVGQTQAVGEVSSTGALKDRGEETETGTKVLRSSPVPALRLELCISFLVTNGQTELIRKGLSGSKWSSKGLKRLSMQVAGMGIRFCGLEVFALRGMLQCQGRLWRLLCGIFKPTQQVGMRRVSWDISSGCSRPKLRFSYITLSLGITILTHAQCRIFWINIETQGKKIKFL